MKPTISITVAAVVERGSQFLFVEEHDQERAVINQPAGHLEAGEALVDAAVRETLEETGWEFQPKGLVGLYRWTHVDKAKTYVRACFFGTAGHHDPQLPLDTGILRALWLDRAALAAQSPRLRSPLVLRCLDDYLAGKRYPLDFLVDVV